MTKGQFPTDQTKAQWQILEPLLRRQSGRGSGPSRGSLSTITMYVKIRTQPGQQPSPDHHQHDPADDQSPGQNSGIA